MSRQLGKQRCIIHSKFEISGPWQILVFRQLKYVVYPPFHEVLNCSLLNVCACVGEEWGTVAKAIHQCWVDLVVKGPVFNSDWSAEKIGHGPGIGPPLCLDTATANYTSEEGGGWGG